MMISNKISLIIVPFILLATFALVYFTAIQPNAISEFWQPKLLANSYLDRIMKYQLVTLAIALLLLLTTRFLNPQSTKKYFRMGDIDAPADPVKLLGIKATDGWKKVGFNFGVIVTAVTAIFIYFNVIQGQELSAQFSQV